MRRLTVQQPSATRSVHGLVDFTSFIVSAINLIISFASSSVFISKSTHISSSPGVVRYCRRSFNLGIDSCGDCKVFNVFK